jgi:hypothetical protein
MIHGVMRSRYARYGIALLLAVGAAALTVAAEKSKAPECGEHCADPFPGLDSVSSTRAVAVKPEFSTPIHVRLVRSDARAKQCSDVLARAQWQQDIVLALDATAHFDNCRFDESVAVVQTEMRTAIAAGKQKQQQDALAALGRALHGIQDFYSHTNYVELSAKKYARLEDVPIVTLWNDAGIAELKSLTGSGLRSGYVWWERGDACGKGGLTHAALNKDEPSGHGAEPIVGWKRTHHQAARDLAQQATEEFLRVMLAQDELRWLANACNARLQYLLLSDRRTGW